MDYMVRTNENPRVLAGDLKTALELIRPVLETERAALDAARRSGAPSYGMAEVHANAVNALAAAVMVLEQVQTRASEEAAS